MNRGDISLACAWALVDELVAGGVRHACLSPGSRSTALALALARHPGIDLHVHLDERSGAFFALGVAKATFKPVIVACTSGTAAAELLPAVVEASQSRMPLVLLTADRPSRLRGTGANQTIDQVRLYRGHARTYEEPPVPTSEADVEAWRVAGRRALEAFAPVPGPVHVNCSFEEPLAPSGGEASLNQTSGKRPRRTSPEATLTPEESDRFAHIVSGARGVVLIGGWPTELDGEARFWSEVMRWPVMAEPQSNARRAGLALSAGQALLTSDRWIDGHRPEVVVQLGATPTTRASQALVASAEQLVVVDRFHLDPDPEARATLRLHVDPRELPAAFRGRALVQGDSGFTVVGKRSEEEIRSMWERRVEPPPLGWTAEWQGYDERARKMLDAFLDGSEEPFEPRIARDVAAAIPDGGILFVGNSTPIRDLDLAMAPRDGLRVLANRGASGIDGLVSTAMGIAASGRARSYALIGDLSFLYDAGALLWNAKRMFDPVLVVVNNGGGEVFSLLPQRKLPEHRDLFVTPHGLDLGALCAAAGAGHKRVEQADELTGALAQAAGAGGIQVVEVIVDPELGLRRRAELQDVVDGALAAS